MKKNVFQRYSATDLRYYVVDYWSRHSGYSYIKYSEWCYKHSIPCAREDVFKAITNECNQEYDRWINEQKAQ